MKAVFSRQKLEGTAQVPSSKSYTIRAIVIALLSGTRCRIDNPLESADTVSALYAAEAFGAHIDREDGAWIITGPAKLVQPKSTVDIGNSGTALYFFASVAALLPGKTIFTGDAQTRKRPIIPLLKSLTVLGASCEFLGNPGDTIPVSIQGPIHGGVTHITGATSQYMSSLLLTAPYVGEDVNIICDNPVELPYIDMTLEYMEKAGVSVDRDGYNNFTVAPGRYDAASFTIPADWSSAAFPMICGLLPGSSVSVCGLDFYDQQGDKKIVEFLESLGAHIEKDESEGTLTVFGDRQLHGAYIDMKDNPDALPALTVAASFATGDTVFANVSGIRQKETDRVLVMQENLQAMGVSCDSDENTMTVHGTGILHGADLLSYGDHRIAMALSAAGMFASEITTIEDADRVSVSFPGFFEMLKKLGAKVRFQ